MNRYGLGLLTLLWLGSTNANAAAITSPCAACHGPKGEGNPTLAAPPLAGQRADYLARQLRDFRAGLRGTHRDDQAGARMRAVALTLKEADIEALATNYAALPITLKETPPGDAQTGKAGYLGNCAMCHGEKAEGYDPLQSPSLRALDHRYLSAQFAAYQKGWRGQGENVGQPAQWMRSIAGQISDPQELANISAYIASLR